EAIANLPKVPQDDIKEITRRRQILQQAVYDDAPYIPVQNSGTGGMYTTKKWSGLKKAEDVDYFPRASGYNNMIHT
ncbi:ABC transporter substrate-binding protein, partial [Barnesiella sp. GGCC_0306]|nr:ABC transporter substrate-binding protein [Barnesiella sp. GGCC_0306]